MVEDWRREDNEIRQYSSIGIVTGVVGGLFLIGLITHRRRQGSAR